MKTGRELRKLLVYAETHNLQCQPQPWRQRALASRYPLNNHSNSTVVSRVRGTVGHAKIMKLAKSSPAVGNKYNKIKGLLQTHAALCRFLY